MRVCLIADMLEENWASMDLFPEMLSEFLPRADASITVETFRLPLKRRIGRLVRGNRTLTTDRLIGRHWDYPRKLRRHLGKADIYHILDQSYAASAHSLPPGRTVVTCHDLDAFSALDTKPESIADRVLAPLARLSVAGLKRAGRVVCDSRSVRDEIGRKALLPEERVSVIPLGVHPLCTREAEPAADAAIAALIGPRRGPEILHVGTAIPRKRIDTLLTAFAGVRRRRPNAKLIRMGGAFTPSQRSAIMHLGIEDGIAVLPFLDRSNAAAVYRRATLLVLPSENEGFGLPVVESMACGTPVLARNIEVLREVGGSAAEYVEGDDPALWTGAILALLDERESRPLSWAARVESGLTHSSAYSWDAHARLLVNLYRTMVA